MNSQRRTAVGFIAALMLSPLTANLSQAQLARPAGGTRLNMQNRTNVNRNVNVNQNVNVNRNVNSYHGGCYNCGWHDSGWNWGAFAAGAATTAVVSAAARSAAQPAAVVVAAPVVGTVVPALPATCATVGAGTTLLYNCSNIYYQPFYQGTTLVFRVVTHP